MIHRPVETAIAEGDYIIDVLLEAGAEFNIGTYSAQSSYAAPEDKKTILDWVVYALEVDLPEKVKQNKAEREKLDNSAHKTYTSPEKITSWKEYFDDFVERRAVGLNKASTTHNEQQRKNLTEWLEEYEKRREYLQHVRLTLESMGAKTWKEIHGSNEEEENNMHPISHRLVRGDDGAKQLGPRYMFLSKDWRNEWVQQDQNERYDELFEAAFRGDDVKIEKLCVPGDGEDASVVPVQITVEAVMPEDHHHRLGESSFHCRLSVYIC